MKIIFAQGNPGQKYAGSRHNVAWQFVDAFARQQGASFNQKTKLKAEVAEFTASGVKCLIVKPTTFYNETGQSARAVADFYKLLPEDFLIVHDDLALPLGTLRIRVGGTSAGNNGIKSLSSHLGENTARLRIGVHSEQQLGDNVTKVLGAFSEAEAKDLAQLEPKVFETINQFAEDNLVETTHR